MKQLIIQLILFLNTFVVIGQSVVSGTIIDKFHEPIAFALIIEKGTSNKTYSDLEGKFSLKLINDSSEVEISSIGYLSQNLKAHFNQDLVITLEEHLDIIIDEFPLKYIAFSLISAVSYTPVGFQLEYFSPFPFRFIPEGKYSLSYQSDLLQNMIFTSGFRSYGLLRFRSSDVDLSLNYSYYRINLDSLMKLYEYSVGIDFDLHNVNGTITLGPAYHQVNYLNQTSGFGVFIAYSGYLKNTGLSYSLDLFRLSHYWKIKSMVGYNIRKTRFNFSVSYNQFLDYKDYLMNLRYRIHYY